MESNIFFQQNYKDVIKISLAVRIRASDMNKYSKCTVKHIILIGFNKKDKSR